MRPKRRTRMQAARLTFHRKNNASTRSCYALRMYDRIFLFHPPRRDLAKKITRCARDVFGFRDAAIDQCASSTCPNLPDDERTIFANNSAEVLNGRSGSRSSDRFLRMMRCEFAIAPCNFANAQCEERVRRAV